MTWVYVDGHQSFATSSDEIESLTCVGPIGDNSPANGQHGYLSATDSVQTLTLYYLDRGGYFNGLQVSYYDGTTDTASDHNPQMTGKSGAVQIRLNRGEAVTYLEIREPQGGTVNYVRIKTAEGQDIIFGNASSTGTPSIFQGDSLGTGILQGVFGYEGNWLNSIGFIFSKKEVSESLTNFTWNVDESNVTGDQIVALQDVTIINASNEAQSVQISVNKSLTLTDSWSSSAAISYGQSLKISAEVPVEIVKVGVEVTFSFNETYTTDSGGSSSQQVGYSAAANVNAAPRTIQTAHARLRELRLDVPWQATWTKKFVDGSSSSEKVSGVYHGVSYQEYQVVFDPQQSLAPDYPQANAVTQINGPVNPALDPSGG